MSRNNNFRKKLMMYSTIVMSIACGFLTSRYFDLENNLATLILFGFGLVGLYCVATIFIFKSGSIQYRIFSIGLSYSLIFGGLSGLISLQVFGSGLAFVIMIGLATIAFFIGVFETCRSFLII